MPPDRTSVVLKHTEFRNTAIPITITVEGPEDTFDDAQLEAIRAKLPHQEFEMPAKQHGKFLFGKLFVTAGDGLNYAVIQLRIALEDLGFSVTRIYGPTFHVDDLMPAMHIDGA